MSSNDNPIVVDPVSETIQSTCSFYRRLADYKRRPEFEASDNQIKVELLYIELFVCFETYQHVRAQSLESLAALERDCQSCESEVNLIQLILGANRNVIGSQIERHLYRTAINLSNAIRLIRWIVNCIQIELALNQYSICESKKVQTIFKQKLTNFLNVKFCLHPFVTLHSGKED